MSPNYSNVAHPDILNPTPRSLRFRLFDRRQIAIQLAGQRTISEDEKDRFAHFQRGDLYEGEDDTPLGVLLSSEVEEELNERLRCPCLEHTHVVVSPRHRLANPDNAAPLDRLVRDGLLKVKQQWRRIYKNQGLRGLAETVMVEEIGSRLEEKKRLYENDADWSADVMEHILLSTDKILLESILFGNLAIDKRRDPKLKKILTDPLAQSRK